MSRANNAALALAIALIMLVIVVYGAIRQQGGSWAGIGVAVGVCILVAGVFGVNWPAAGEVVQAIAIVALTEGLRRLAELANRHLLADFVKQLRTQPNHKKTSRKTERFSDMAVEVLTALLSPLRSPQERVRKYAIDVLSKQRVIDHVVRLRHGPLLQRLMDAMTDSDAYVRWKAVRAVSPYASDEVFIRPFIRAMEDEDPRVREAAVRAACPDVSSGVFIRPLLRALEDDDLRVREASGCVLRRAGLVRVILRLVFRARDRQLYIGVLRAWGRSARRDGASLKAKNARSASRRS